MSCKVLYGKPVSEKIKSELKNKINNLSLNGIIPKLSVILIGDDPASKIYVNSKHKTFINMGCKSDVHILDKNCNETEVVNLIDKLNGVDLLVDPYFHPNTNNLFLQEYS